MLYQTWNYRCVPLFIEEEPENTMASPGRPSIQGFRQQGIYTGAERKRLADYIHQCPSFVATSFRRLQPYRQTFSFELAYYTDGEIIFNNFLRDYILEPDFAIPSAWLKIIREKEFTPDRFSFDFDALRNNDLDIFSTISETFERPAAIKKALLYHS